MESRHQPSRRTPRQPAGRLTWAPIALAALWLVLALPVAGRGDLYNETDGQYASAAARMAAGGSWLIPENNGVPRLVKPPFLVWMTAASFGLLGPNEFAARLPVLIGTALWAFATALLAFRISNCQRTAFLAGAILLTSLGTLTLGRIVMPETWFCAWITIALLGVRGALEDPLPAGGKWTLRHAHDLVFWTACGLACFAKGWHGLVIPCLIAAGTCAWAGRLPALRQLLFSPWGWVIFFAINLPWLLAMEFRFPGFLHHFFISEGLGHATGSDAPDTSYTSVPRAEFFALHFAWFFPWILPFLAALRRAPALVRAGICTTGGRLLWVWAVVGLAILVLAGQRQDYYGMFLWPVFAMACAFSMRGATGRSAESALAILGVLGILAAATFDWWRPILRGESTALDQRETAADAFAGLAAGAWEPVVNLLLAVSVVWLVAGIAGIVLAGKTRGSPAVACWLIAAVATALAGAEGMARMAPAFSHAEMGRWLLANAPAHAEVCFDGGIDTGSSLLFHSGRAESGHPLRLLEAEHTAAFATRTFGIGMENYWRRDQLQSTWESQTPVFFVTEQSMAPHWKLLLPAAEEVLFSGTQTLLANPAASEQSRASAGQRDVHDKPVEKF